MPASAPHVLLFSFLAGSFIAWISVALLAGFFEWLRDRGYARQKKSRPVPALLPDQSTIPNQTGLHTLQSVSHLIRNEQERAKSLQNQYHKVLAKVVAATLVAFGLMALHLLGLHPNQVLHLTQIWMEALLLASIFFLYRRARSIRKQWISSRSLTELMRQFNYVALLVPSSLLQSSGKNITERYESEFSRIRLLFENTSIEGIVKAIIAIWAERKSQVSTVTESERFDADNLHHYIRLRPEAQLSWFSTALDRVEIGLRFRERCLRVLFFTAIFLAFIRLFLAVGLDYAVASAPAYEGLVLAAERFSQLLAPALLIVTGISATFTAYAMGNNSRGLSHLYRSQAGKISAWLTEYRRIPAPVSHSQVTQVIEHVLRFEEMMVSELIDWIHVTDNDALELAP